MKNIIFGIAISLVSFTACNNDNNKFTEDNKKNSDTAQANNMQPMNGAANDATSKSGSSIKEVVGEYLQIKNALANDNGKDAATAGKAMVDALSKVDKTSFTADQKKVYEDAADDVKENAEHIGDNGDKIDHQREHFDMLSKDLYDMVKTFGAGTTLYQDYCPMYNNKKGATWLSETKEIKNPYLGGKMPTCGSVKEELK
ncbi:MAG: DUF3347 domain-containing protein [Chitinophagaceae bacterium]